MSGLRGAGVNVVIVQCEHLQRSLQSLGVMKHIFIGIDGTSQAAFYDAFFSNVYRLNLALASRDKDKDQHHQIFIYLSGVGAKSYHYFGLR